ncbi:MAG: acylphosphatase [Phycisphaerae bacterium]|nr:acylphosphatase [Phycisphaerae bacterium]
MERSVSRRLCMNTRMHIYYSGRVQGVGFRYTVIRLAAGRPVTGFVKNLRDGRVEVVAEGEEKAVEGLLNDIDRVMQKYIEDRSLVRETPTGEFREFQVATDN